MYCRNCKTELSDQAVACTNCGAAPKAGTAYCWSCGSDTAPAAAVCTNCGVGLRATPSASKSDKKLPAGLTALLLSGLGIHKFILGYNTEGLIMLLVTVLTCGIGWIVMGPISIIEGIIYLTKTDEEFDAIYVQGRKGWF